MNTSTSFHKNLAIGLRQSPGIEIVGEGGSIEGIQPPSPTTQSRELSRNSNGEIFMKRCTGWIFVSLLALSLSQCKNPSSESFKPSPSPVIERSGYTLSYDGKTRHASWVYEELTADSLQGSTDRAEFDFMEDPLIPASLRATKKDYKGSGFDRGHLSPAGNARGSSEAMKESFYLSNVSPQHPQLNRKYWVKLERHVREMTENYSKVFVITGPLFLPEKDKDGKKYVRYQVIGENNVAVPTHYFKVIYGKKAFLVETEAYIIPNQPIENDPPLKTFEVALEKVEKAAGIIF